MIKRKANIKKIFLIFLCGFTLFVCGVSVAYDGFRFAKADSSAEQTEIDIATVCGADCKIVKGAEVLGDTGKSKYYTIKARLYLGEDFDVTFYLNTDGTATNGRPFGGAIYIHFNSQCLSWGWPGAQGLLGMAGEDRNGIGECKIKCVS